MQLWEYLIIDDFACPAKRAIFRDGKTIGPTEFDEARLNEIGNDGWELVALHPNLFNPDEGQRAIFKRAAEAEA